MAEPTTGTTIVTDHRTPPRGVLPRGAQTWLMVALALGILAIIVLTGRPEPPARPAAGPVNQALAPSPDRLPLPAKIAETLFPWEISVQGEEVSGS